MPPTVTVISPNGGEIIGPAGITINWTAVDPAGLPLNYNVYYSPTGGSAGSFILIVSGLTTTSYFWNTSALPSGQNYIVRVLASNGSESGFDDSNAKFTIDNIPPVVSIDSPPDGSVVRDTVPLFISASDNFCLAKVNIYVDGQLIYTELEGSAASTSFIYEWDTTQLSEGAHVVRAIAIDCAGNSSLPAVKTYIVDNLPPCFTQVLIDGYLQIPPQKPDVEHIIAFEIVWSVKEIKTLETIFGTKVLVSGFLELDVAYSAVDLEQTEHFASFVLPFAGIMLCPDIPLDTCLCPVIQLEHEQHHLVTPRSIKKDIVLFIGVRPC